jgi:two-component system NarL family sensor kinase
MTMLLLLQRRFGSGTLPGTVARPLVQFAVAGIAALLVLATILTVILDRTGTSEAISNARQYTSLVAQDVIEPYLTDAVLDGDHGALAGFDDIVRQRVIRGAVVRVKVWTRDGRVAYSDEPRLIGRRFTIEDDQRLAFGTGQVVASITDLSRPENQYEQNHRDHQLLEVYQAIRTPDGTVVLYENYLRFDTVQATGRQIMLSFVPAVFGTLVVMELLQLSLAWSLARRVRDGLRDRERLLKRAVDAGQLERRRIAQDLHDGTVQDLTAVSLSLEVTSRQLGREGQPLAAKTLDEAAAETRKSVRQLRTLFVDIYPDTLHDQGIEVALRDLLDPFEVRGISTSLNLAHGLRLWSEDERVIFRVARETLRNVARHAHARSVAVSLTSGPATVALVIKDDGRGFDPTVPNKAPGHLGLRLMTDLARDAGGTFRVVSEIGAGTEVRLELPKR